MAQEAREKLQEAKVTLVINPLKDITAVPAEETVKDARAGLFKRWLAVYQGALALPNQAARAWFDTQLDWVQKMMDREDVKVNKETISVRIELVNAWLVYCQGHPTVVPA